MCWRFAFDTLAQAKGRSGLTVSIHSGFDAFLETTGSTLVAVGLVYLTTTLAFILANVLAVSSDRALEKSSAPENLKK